MTVSTRYGTGWPPEVIPVSVPAAASTGSMARSPLAPPVMPNVSALPFQASPVKAEALRPSSQVSICRPETTGAPCALAAATTASEAAEAAKSVWMLAVSAA